MKYAITNLVFPDQINPNFLKEINDNGITGVEIAPTKIANWDDLTVTVLQDYKKILNESGLEVSSLQSLFFGLQDCQLIGSNKQFDNMLNHFYKIIDIANVLDANICLFGSPRSRLKLIEDNDCIESTLHHRMELIAEIFAKSGKILVVESIPTQYGGQTLIDYKSVLALVRFVNNMHLKMHLDIGCVTTAGDDISQAIMDCGRDLLHYQASEKNIGSFLDPIFPHHAASNSLAKIDYKGWVSIEMIGITALNDILGAINYVRESYR